MWLKENWILASTLGTYKYNFLLYDRYTIINVGYIILFSLKKMISILPILLSVYSTQP